MGIWMLESTGAFPAESGGGYSTSVSHSGCELSAPFTTSK